MADSSTAYLSPESRARIRIDDMLGAAGWAVQDYGGANLSAARGVAVREFVLAPGHGRADYLLFVDGNAVGALEAKKEGETLTGVAWQTAKYVDGIPEDVPTALEGALPFVYQSTGTETRFTNTLDPEPTSRDVFWFHRPETLARWLEEVHRHPDAPTLRHRLRQPRPLGDADLWPAQVRAIHSLEDSLAANRPRALIQMATGSGKTYTAANIAYRLIKHGDARRVLFLVDRANLGRQTLKEFQGFTVPDTNRKFTELYNVQHLGSNRRKLLHECDLHTLLRLPTGIFYAQGVKANVLFFDRKPASETPWTNELWIYDFRTNQHFTLKQNPLRREDLDDFVAAYNTGARGQREKSERFRRFTYDELLQRDKVSLDITWLRDKSLEDVENLPPPDVIAQEIAEDLEAALAEFAAISASLAAIATNREGAPDADAI